MLRLAFSPRTSKLPPNAVRQARDRPRRRTPPGRYLRSPCDPAQRGWQQHCNIRYSTASSLGRLRPAGVQHVALSLLDVRIDARFVLRGRGGKGKREEHLGGWRRESQRAALADTQPTIPQRRDQGQLLWRIQTSLVRGLENHGRWSM